MQAWNSAERQNNSNRSLWSAASTTGFQNGGGAFQSKVFLDLKDTSRIMQETEIVVLKIFSVKRLLKLQLLHFTEKFTSNVNRWELLREMHIILLVLAYNCSLQMVCCVPQKTPLLLGSE